MISAYRNIASYAEEYSVTLQRAEAPRYFLLHFGHARLSEFLCMGDFASAKKSSGQGSRLGWGENSRRFLISQLKNAHHRNWSFVGP